MPAKTRTTTRKRAKPVVGANASAKVEAVAKASYEHKKTVNVTEIIPPDVIRAKSNAWLDLISPLTEWAGLKGDELRFKRMQLRLQREDVLTKIVECAREKITDISQIEKPIPNKFLVPFLEQASLEDLDSSLIDMWASLLASSAMTFSSHHIHFVSIISQLSPKQGMVLKSLIGTQNAYDCELGIVFIHDQLQSSSIRRAVREQLARKLTGGELAEAILSLFKHTCVTVVHAAYEDTATGQCYDVMHKKHTDEVDYAILEAVGLIKQVDTDLFDLARWKFSANYYYLTDLGFHFAKACGIVRDGPSPGKFIEGER